jgi:hypothetical protein
MQRRVGHPDVAGAGEVPLRNAERSAREPLALTQDPIHVVEPGEHDVSFGSS